MESNKVPNNITAILEQAKEIVSDRKYGLGIVYVYFAGGTLCLDINDKNNKKFLVMVNISSEKYSVEKSDGRLLSFLLPIKALKLAFEIYEMVKGKTDYFESSYKKSCLRHLKK